MGYEADLEFFFPGINYAEIIKWNGKEDPGTV